MTFAGPNEHDAAAPSRVTFTIEPHEEIVRLTVIHEDLANQADYEAPPPGGPPSSRT